MDCLSSVRPVGLNSIEVNPTSLLFSFLRCQKVWMSPNIKPKPQTIQICICQQYLLFLFKRNFTLTIRYDFRIKTMFGCLYPQLLVWRFMSYLCFVVCLFGHSDVKYVWTIWATCRTSYKRDELLTLHEYLG
jgi:hypothetical protein